MTYKIGRGSFGFPAFFIASWFHLGIIKTMADFVKCMVCNQNFAQISWQHLRSHSMSFADYRVRFPDAALISTAASERKSRKMVEVAKRRGLNSGKKRVAPPKNDTVACCVCGKECQQITVAHLKMHKLSMADYRQLYPDAVLTNKRVRDLVMAAKTGVPRGDGFSLRQSLARQGTQPSHLRGIMNNEIAKKISRARLSCTDEAALLMDNKEDFINLLQSSSIHEMADFLNVSTSHIRARAKHHGYIFEPKSSSYEEGLSNFLTNHGIAHERWRRDIIPPFELDVYLPDYNLAIEMCGLYWHSDAHVDNLYHRNKLDMCNAKGIDLITIFEDEWLSRIDIVKSILLNKLRLSPRGVGGRKLSIDTISTNEAKSFLDQHHLQGGATSSYRLGAFHEDKMVGVMVFSPSWRNSGKIWELRRFATNGSSYPGMAAKFLSTFIKNVAPDSIVSYADRRWSSGNVYRSMGFRNGGIVQPSYYYIERDKRLDKSLFRKGSISHLVDQGDEKTERQIMEELGYLRIYDCGHIRFDWDKSG